jgi:GTPase SAR1 family protein
MANSLITPDIKRDIIKGDGTELYFYVNKLRDEDVVNFLNDHDVNPGIVTAIHLSGCKGITDKALIAIADTCPNLTELHVSFCRNITGPGIEAIARKCRKLRTLFAPGCNISHLPGDIGMLLPHLTTLQLQKNKIKKIPASLGPLADTLIFDISSNPIQQPPLEIANKGLHAIQRYYKELKIGTQQISNEIKVVFVGHGEAGKTSLLNCILGKSNPRTTEKDRTIYVDHQQFSVPRGNNEPDLMAIGFDLAGQEFYDGAQTPMITPSALHFLAVNADETNPENYLRHLNQLQPRAPGAPVQIVLTKSDLVENPQEKAEEVRDNVIHRMKMYETLWNKKGSKGTAKRWNNNKKRKGNKGTTIRWNEDENITTGPNLIRILPEVIFTSVEDDAEGAKEKILAKILELSKRKDLLPSVGQPIPERWAKLYRLIDARRAYDDIENEELFRIVQGDGKINQSSENAGTFYYKRSKLQTLFQELCVFDGTDATGMNIDDALSLLEAQGGIYTHGDLIFLQPKFVGEIMAALTDHRLAEELRTSQSLKNDILKYGEENNSASDAGGAHWKLKKGLEQFVKTGALNNANVPKFLLRHVLELSPDDYPSIIRMLVDLGVIFLTSLQDSTEDLPDTLEDIIALHPVVIFRLPRQRPPLDEKLWPEQCPEDQKEKEIHIELPNCPPNLPPIFAAQIHSEGRCCYAWLKGVVVQVPNKGGAKIRIRAELVENSLENGGDYLLLAVRTTADTFGKEIHIFNKMFAFMTEEREERLPGLFFTFVVRCPHCKKGKIECSPEQGDDEQKYVSCEECYENVSIGEHLNFSASSSALASAETASRIEQIQNQTLLMNLNAYEILISARFDGSWREQQARDLKDELVKIGVDARMVEAAAGRNFGDETHKYLYSMKAMIAFCFEDYGQKTKSMYSTYWELKYAYGDEDKRIIPIKRCVEWPPKPIDHDGGNEGIIQNTIVFKPGVAYINWSNKNWNPAECAKDVEKALVQTHSPQQGGKTRLDEGANRDLLPK